MNSALDELGDMIRKQQQLRDRTFKQGQDSRRDQQQLGRTASRRWATCSRTSRRSRTA